jgi:PAS domain S-box-containing protein
VIELSEYNLETLRKDGEFILYRGERRRQTGASAPSILAVTPASERPTLACLRRMEHEYSLRTELDPAWAAVPLALTRHEGRTILVLKDPGGEPLDQVLKRDQGQSLDLNRCLRSAIGLATILGQVHRRGLVHKDIKPPNVLVDSATNQVWLMGFAIASRLPRERQSPEPPEFIAGTLAYMAPEQTGRMNRSIDTRSDLYSLGVTLYEMLTGSLPFTVSVPMEWVHCHIARKPVPPSERFEKIPAPVSQIIVKLLAKTAEERYQTAAGVDRDLRRCLAEWELQGRIDPFLLGEHDTPDRLLIPEKLYGREREIDALLAAFDRVVAEGTPELVLVSGYSGVGKSSVVNELHKVLVLPRGLFASGKFDQYKRDIPYATLAQAFLTLVRQILAKSEAEVAQWRHALTEAVGSNGQLIVGLVPELEFIIGKQPSIPDLPPQAARNRFQMMFRRFIGAFARPEHSLVLFLDDLQWLDAATLELLEHLITEPDVRHLMLIGAYRDNEVSPSHPLLRTLAAIREAGARVQEIVLPPLGLDDVGTLVSDALLCMPEYAHSLAQLVQEKTAGNPFFAIQFLTALGGEGLLRRDPDAGAWVWDLARIRTHGYTDNVVDLMVEKLKRLSETAQTALQQLACLGSIAEIATLSVVFGQSEEKIHTALLDAARAGLILRLEGSYAFLHDRIQEAAYSLIPESERAGAHLRIGRVLLATMSENQLDEQLFDVANQLNRGAGRLADPNEKAEVATFNLRTGRRAKASAAYASASTYFASGIALLDGQDWGNQHELKFSLSLEFAECELLCGSLEKALQLILELLQRAASDVEFANASCLKINLHVLRGEHPQAIDSALTCLRRFGIDLPEHPTLEQVRAEYETLWQALNGRPIESLIDLPLMTDPKIQAAMQVLSVLAGPATFTDFQLFCLLACRMVNVSIQHGMSGASAYAYACLGSVLGANFHRYREGYRMARLACDLVEKHGFTAYDTKVYHAMGLAAFWTEPITSVIELRRATTRTATERGDLTFACYGMHQSITHLLTRNDPLDAVWRESEMALDFARTAKFRDVVDLIGSQQRFIASMQGRDATFSTFNDERFDEAAFEAQLTAARTPTVICLHWIRKLKARYLSGDYAEAQAAADKAKVLLRISTVQLQLLDYFYYTALTVAALYENGTADEQNRWRELLRAHREQLCEWAENYPPTFSDKHALVSAELARIEGRALDAMHLYDQAIQSAREHGFVQNEALAHEVAARFYLARGFEMIAHTYLRNARNCYDRWGALGKVKQLDERYSRLQEERLPVFTTATIGAPVGQLDVEAVVRASQAFSSEMVLDKLIEKLMRIAVEHAGAERGLLILLRGDEPRIEAEATTGHKGVEVAIRRDAVTPSSLPLSALHYMIRTGERVVLDDASAANLYSEDEYLRQKQPRSVLCVAIVNQSKLVGALYMENNLTPRAFTSERVAVLELLASQAAISIENATLYSDLQRSYSDLRRSESFLAEGQALSHTGSFGWHVVSGEIHWSEETHDIFEVDPADKPTLELVFQRMHPGDRDRVQQALDRAISEKTDFDIEHRLQMPDGRVKHLHVIGCASDTSSDRFEFVGAVTDVTAAKQAEDKIRQSEQELRQILDFAPQQVGVLGPDRTRLYLNQASLDYLGLTLEEWQSGDNRTSVHPDDWERLMSQTQSKFLSGIPHEAELRLLRKDGTYRWFFFRYNPLRDQQGRLRRWYVAGTDIEDRKQAEQRLQNENIALREEIDETSMFEEIVGSSESLRKVLVQVAKVAQSHSTVLILGETGTGKELIARAIHKRSNRSTKAFVRVNCAAIPPALIPSELFGHEKGAFTGALQRRLGRFELADGGTIFLDEVGDLPAETQIALLRVLQEREFERVGSSKPISINVRVLAATNRNLTAAVEAGTFRQDLFYRLNVFPITVPPLRERLDDIPLLVEYLIERYAKAAGKTMTGITKKTLEMFQNYRWPGNVRELQNVVERAIVLCESTTFSVNETWLKSELPQEREYTTVDQRGLGGVVADREKALIETALAESKGRIAGPVGAAVRLGIPRSTLESKIRSLGINKHRFKT